MKIFEIGLIKTGTSSLARALKILGYNVKGFDREAVDLFIRNGVDAISSTLDEYSAFRDAPWHNIDISILDNSYPKSKFIYLDRNDDKWFCSLMDHWKRGDYISNGKNMRYQQYIKDPDMIKNEMLDKKHRKFDVMSEYFKNRPDDLLIMNICDDGDGYDKLCPFLGVDVICNIFPKEYTAEVAWDLAKRRRNDVDSGWIPCNL